MTFNLEAVRRALEGSALTCGNAVLTGDADRFSVSGTASWAKGRLGWYTLTENKLRSSQRSHPAAEKLSWLLRYLEPVKACVYDSSGTGCENLETMQRRRAQHGNRSNVVIPLQL